MKKLKLLVVSAVIAGVFASCSLGIGGNPLELNGTWTSSIPSNSGTVAGSIEGTWVNTSLILQPSATTVSAAGVIDAGASTITETITTTAVIAADGSYQATVVDAVNQAARAAITADATHVGYAAIAAGTFTTTNVYTGTVTPTGFGNYNEARTVSTTTVGTGAFLSASTTTTSSNSLYKNNVASGSLGFNDYDNGVQTVVAGPKATSTDSSLVIKDDGTFTTTTTTTVTQAAAAATSATPAVAAGTQVTVTTTTGTLYGNVSGASKSIVLTVKTLTTTKSGTGALINQTFPATAYTTTNNNYYGQSQFDYFLSEAQSGTYLNLSYAYYTGPITSTYFRTK